MEIAISLVLGFVLGMGVTIGLVKTTGSNNVDLDNQGEE